MDKSSALWEAILLRYKSFNWARINGGMAEWRKWRKRRKRTLANGDLDSEDVLLSRFPFPSTRQCETAETIEAHKSGKRFFERILLIFVLLSRFSFPTTRQCETAETIEAHKSRKRFFERILLILCLMLY